VPERADGEHELDVFLLRGHDHESHRGARRDGARLFAPWRRGFQSGAQSSGPEERRGPPADADRRGFRARCAVAVPCRSRLCVPAGKAHCASEPIAQTRGARRHPLCYTLRRPPRRGDDYTEVGVVVVLSPWRSAAGRRSVESRRILWQPLSRCTQRLVRQIGSLDVTARPRDPRLVRHPRG